MDVWDINQESTTADDPPRITRGGDAFATMAGSALIAALVIGALSILFS